jgi:zinc transporter ZupT
MDFSIWMYITIFLTQLVGVSLGLAIFTSIYLKNRTKGFVFLAIIGLGNVYSLIQGFNASIIIGIGMVVIFICLTLVTYFILQQKIENEVTE